MAKAQYEINGQVFESARELTDAELQDVALKMGLIEAQGERSADWMPMIGGTAGGVVGGVVGGVPGAMVGSSIGSAGGEALRQQLTGEDTNVANIVKEGALGAVGEGAGQVLGRVGPSFVRGVKSGLGLEKQAPNQAFSLAERQAAQQTAQELGTSIPASRVGGNFSQLLEGLSRTGLGEGSFIAADKQLAEALTTEAKDIVEKATTNAMTDIEVGDALRVSFENADKAFKDKIAPFFKQIEDMGGNVPIFVDNMAAKAQKKITQSMAMTRSGRTVGLDDDALKILKDIADVKSTLTFSQANQMRSQLLSQQRAFGNKYGPNSEASKLMQETITELSKAMDTGAEALSPRLKKLYSGVNNEYKTVMKDMYDDVVVKLLNKTPERLGESISRSGNVTEVLRVRKALNQAKRQGQNVQAIEENLLQGYLVDITKGLDSSIDNFASLSAKMKDKKFKRTYDVMMQINPAAKANMSKLMKAAEVASKSNSPTILQGKGGVGGLLNTVALMSGGAGYAAGAVSGAGIAVAGALGLQLLAGKAMTSPLITNILLSAESIAQKKGIEAGLQFLDKSQPFRRWMGQELARSDFGPKFGE
jgi:cell division septum initiation protein DivIVA